MFLPITELKHKATTEILSYLTELGNMFRGNCVGEWDDVCPFICHEMNS